MGAAVIAAVRKGMLWLRSGPASLLGEDVPPGVLTVDAILRSPPAPLAPLELLPDRLPEAWRDGATRALSLATALSQRAGETLPWATVRNAIDAALRARLLELAPESGPWPCDWPGAQAVRLRVPQEVVGPGPLPPVPPLPPGSDRRPGALVAEADLRPDQIQDLAEQIGELVRLAAEQRLQLRFRLRLEVEAAKIPGGEGGGVPPSQRAVDRINEFLRRISDDLTVG